MRESRYSGGEMKACLFESHAKGDVSMPLPIAILASLIFGGMVSLAISQALRMSIGYVADLNFIISVAGIVTFFGLLVFRGGIWNDPWAKFFQPQTITLKTERTPYDIFKDGVKSQLAKLFYGGLFFAAVLVFTGNSKILFWLLQVLADKIVRIVQAIFS